LCSILRYRGSEVRTTLFSSEFDHHVCAACQQGVDDCSEEAEDFFCRLDPWATQPEESAFDEIRQPMDADSEQVAANMARATRSQPRIVTHRHELSDEDDKENVRCLDYSESSPDKDSSSHPVGTNASQVKFRDFVLVGALGTNGAEAQSATKSGGAATFEYFNAASAGGCLWSASGGGAMPMSPWPQQMISGGSVPASPMSPGFFPTDPARHASGGGQAPDARKRKARHFFFADLNTSAVFATETPAFAVPKFVPALDSLARNGGC
jgi:hypothetical protein